MKALQLIAALAILVTIHEFGHYFFARLFKIKVEKFYLFFNPWFSLVKYDPMKGTLKIFSTSETDAVKTFQIGKPREPRKDGKPTWRDTEYGLGWLPLGGYCKIAGMIDESMDKEQLAQEPQPWEFRTKPAWQRLFVMVGGVLFNFILAIIIYAGIAFTWGEKTIEFADAKEGFDFVEAAQKIGFQNGDIPLLADGDTIKATDRQHLLKMIEADTVTVLRGGDKVNIAIPDDFLFRLNEEEGFLAFRVPVVVKDVVKGQPADVAGLKVGDKVLMLGGKKATAYTDFTAELNNNKNSATEISVLRGDSILILPITPTENAKIGIALAPITEIYRVTVVEYGFFQSIPKGIEIGVNTLTSYVGSLKHLFTKEGATSMGGFGAIGDMFPSSWNWLSFWEITAFLSVILAFMNIIPIPALDGGHVLFVLYEIVTRRKPSDKFLEYAQMAGMIFLFALLIYANGLDIIRAIF